MKLNTEYSWLNEDSRTFLSRGYLLEGVTPEERVRQIAEYSEKILGIEGFADKFEGYMKRGFYSLSTPIWCNFGLDRGFGISCFSVESMDSVDSILYSASEIGMLSKFGGGTAGYFGNLRPRGSEIKNNGFSSGAVSFLNIFQSVSSTVNQGSSRRGQFAAYLPIEHGDFHEFMDCRSEGSDIQDLSLGITVSDEFMDKLVNRDKDSEERWIKVIKKRFETGYPYVMYEGNTNKNKPKVYKDKGLDIKVSNLCVTGDQLVPTQFGLKTAESLYNLGKKLILTDGYKSVNSSEMKLISDSEPVYKITLDNGMSHTVTKDHKLKIYDTSKKLKYEVKKCEDLKIGDRLCVQTSEGVFGSKSMVDEAYLLGLYQGDGTQCQSSCMIDIWENNFDLLEDIQSRYDRLINKYSFKERYSTKGGKFIDCNTGLSKVKKKRLSSNFLKVVLNFEKGYIPDWIYESDKETQWAYIKGLLETDGTVHIAKSNGSPLQLNYSDINIDHLKGLQLLFANLGIKSSIRLLMKGGQNLLPDGKGGRKLYNTKDCFRLIVGNRPDAITIENNTSFLTRKGIKLEDKNYRDNTKKSSKVVSVEYLGEQPVYCVTVDSEDHFWVCNGVITHNCSEIQEITDKDKSFTCCLSSLNLLNIDEIAKTDAIETLTYFLDSVLTDFIKRAKGIKFLERVVKFAEEHRSIGIGVLGYHSYLQSKMIPFESVSARSFNKRVFKIINERSLKASKELAEKYGEPVMLKGYGERMTTRMAVAPTTSSSFILGQVSPSIEPLNSNYFLKDLAKGKFSYKNPYLIDLLESKGKNNDKTWKSILTHGGSVQHLTYLTEDEKAVFKTFGEISQLEIVIQAADRQKFIDQSQSLNLMIHPNTPIHEVHSLMVEAWKLGIKTLYYQRSANLAQEVGRDLMNCALCES